MCIRDRHYTTDKDTILTGKLYTIINKNDHIYIISKDKSFKKSKKMKSIPKTHVDEIRKSANFYTNRQKQFIN